MHNRPHVAGYILAHDIVIHLT